MIYATLEPVVVAAIVAACAWYSLRGMARWLPAPLARALGRGKAAGACAPSACGACSACEAPASPRGAQPVQFVRTKVRPQQITTDSRETLIKE